jgi:2'-phosphotransferase
VRKEDSREVDISKCLSFILRHGATKEGINITTDGFVLVSDILAWNKIKSKKVTMEELVHCVENNDKKRFEFNADKT